MRSLTDGSSYHAMGRFGGMNRRTWNMGRAIGKQFYKAYKSYSSKPKDSRSAKTAEKRVASMIDHSGVLQGVGGSVSYTKIPCSRRKPLGYDLAQNQHYVLNLASRTTSTVGAQNAQSFGGALTKTELGYLLGTVTANVPRAKILIKSVKIKYLFTNQALGNARIVLYDTVAKRDLGSSRVHDPVTAWDSGLQDAGLAANKYKVFDVKPWQSQLFNEFFRIVGRKYLTLAGGAFHEHTISFDCNYVLDGELQASIDDGVKDLTVWTVFIHSGLPANDSTTKTDLSLGGGAIDVVQSTEYIYTYQGATNVGVTISDSLAKTFTVGESIVSEGQNVVATEAFA